MERLTLESCFAEKELPAIHSTMQGLLWKVELHTLDDNRCFKGQFSTQSIGALKLTRSEVSPHLIRHQADHTGTAPYAVTVKTSGKASLNVNSRAIDLKDGEIFFLDTAFEYDFFCQKSATFTSLIIPRSKFDRRFPCAKMMSGRALPDSGGSRIIHELMESIFTNGPSSQELDSDFLAEMLLATCQTAFTSYLSTGNKQASVSNSMLLASAVREIDSRLRDPELTPELIALVLGVSCRHLYTVMKQIDSSPAKYIRERRLDLSRKMLREPAFRHFTISEVAYHCGFNSNTHFSREFRQRFGMPAKEWRQGGPLALY